MFASGKASQWERLCNPHRLNSLLRVKSQNAQPRIERAWRSLCSLEMWLLTPGAGQWLTAPLIWLVTCEYWPRPSTGCFVCRFTDIQPGALLTHQRSYSKFNVQVALKEYAIVLDVIQGPWCFLEIQVVLHPPLFPSHLTGQYGKYISHNSFKEIKIEAFVQFVRKMLSLLHMMSHWNHCVTDIHWKNLWLIPHKHLLVTKSHMRVDFVVLL